MSQTGEKNRRRNQIIAERSADKAALHYGGMLRSDREMWDAIEAALVKARQTAQYQGQVDNSVKFAEAQEAARTVRLRGVQQQLF